jgi:hypothetical protein
MYSYCINKAFVAFHDRPLFRFSPNRTSFADGGGLQNFSLIPLLIMCLQINLFGKAWARVEVSVSV